MSSRRSLAMMQFGTDEPVERGVVLRAGPLTAEFADGALRYVRYHGVEVVRGIAYLFRDRDWRTPATEITGQKVGQGPRSFSVSYDGRIADGGQEFVYRATIEGRSDGSLRFAVEGEARTDLLANRIGFVVLHPLEGVAGEPVVVTHADGSVERSSFPRLISPAQPFFDIRALAHEVLPGVWARCTMEGDAYEMEDHRNWMDASFKTYIRPLSSPRPFQVTAGERLTQSVSLAFEGTPTAPAGPSSAALTVRVGDAAGVMPRIGLSLPPEEAMPALEVADLIRRIAPGYLVGHLDLRDPAAGGRLPDLAAFASAIGAPVVLEIVLPNRRPPEAELTEAAAAVRVAGLVPEAVIPCPHEYLKSWQPNERWPNVPPLEVIYDAARQAFPSALIGGGMLSYFTELNRKRPPPQRIDFVTHTLCPIVHDADDRTIMDNLEALPWIAESVRAIAGGRPWRIGPSAIGMRQNPYGAAPADNPDNRRLAMVVRDPRQRGLFGAAWNLGLLAHAARAGVEAIALSAPTGPFGIVDRETGTFPIWHVLAGLAPAAGRERLETTLSDPRAIQALAWRERDATVLWLANLTDDAQTVAIEGLPGSGAVARLEASRFDSVSDPAGLERTTRAEPLNSLAPAPYGLVRVRVPR